jgi:hypothetical protein
MAGQRRGLQHQTGVGVEDLHELLAEAARPELGVRALVQVHVAEPVGRGRRLGGGDGADVLVDPAVQVGRRRGVDRAGGGAEQQADRQRPAQGEAGAERLDARQPDHAGSPVRST